MASMSFGGENYGLQMGVNSGSVHFHPPKRPETPPEPISNVPFPRDPDFVPRDTLLNQLHNKSLAPGTRIALVGLGGVGKSQLAIEYTYRVRSDSPGTWVFWVHASNEARFEQSFRDIADELKLSGRHDSGVNVFQLMENWLREEKNGSWICVIDNVDDEFLCSLPAARKHDQNTLTKPLIQYVPRRPHGLTIITSRSREIALKMVNDKDLIDVQPMETSEALDLFRKKMDQPPAEDIQQCQQLVKTLELMPLAIVQAASYIRQRAPRYSVSQYLTDLQSDREATELLREEIRHTYRDWESNNSILVTWQASFKYISQMRPSAANLLSFLSFFDRQGIPESLVRPASGSSNKAISPAAIGTCSDSSDSESESSTSDICLARAFEKDVDTPRDFSFISVSEDDTSFKFIMHRLVQLSTRAWLKSHRQEEQWKEKFINTLANGFPSGSYETWEQCRALYPHVKSAMSQRPKTRECQMELSALLYRGAKYAFGLGLLGDMEEMASKSKKQRVKLLSHGSDLALNSAAMLAIAYRNQGRWDEAEQLDVEVMKMSKLKLGEDHPDTLRSMSNLASTYWDQGRWDEAEQLQVQVMETRKSKLGEDHPDTLTSMSNLASTWKSSGHAIKAIDLLQNCLTKQRDKLGSNHPDTLSTSQTLLAWENDKLAISL